MNRYKLNPLFWFAVFLDWFYYEIAEPLFEAVNDYRGKHNG